MSDVSRELGEGTKKVTPATTCTGLNLEGSKPLTFRERARQVSCTWIKAAGATFGIY